VSSGHRSTAVLIWIGLFKLVKVLALVALAAVLLARLHTPLDSLLRHAAAGFGVDPDSRHLAPLAARLHGLGVHARVAIALGALAYAAVFLVEGVGLLAHAVWAEYVTTIVTASLLPLEVYELVESGSLLKVGVIVVNVAIVVYLVWRLRDRGRWPFTHAKHSHAWAWR
jgi:uncharacterized membrane protein (DUF2068 family)